MFFIVQNIQISNHLTHIIRFPTAGILVCSVACCSVFIDLFSRDGYWFVIEFNFPGYHLIPDFAFFFEKLFDLTFKIRMTSGRAVREKLFDFDKKHVAVQHWVKTYF